MKDRLNKTIKGFAGMEATVERVMPGFFYITFDIEGCSLQGQFIVSASGSHDLIIGPSIVLYDIRWRKGFLNIPMSELLDGKLKGKRVFTRFGKKKKGCTAEHLYFKYPRYVPIPLRSLDCLIRNYNLLKEGMK